MIVFRRIFAYIAALARDLSDQTAYARHLQLTGQLHSAAEWKAFSDRQNRRKYQNPKCC